jgi:2-dehydro-3-deoxygalactonokinase
VISAKTKTETVILLDVGSTNSRAWLVRGDDILRRETAAVGVRDSARDGSTARVRETVRDLIATLKQAWPLTLPSPRHRGEGLEASYTLPVTGSLKKNASPSPFGEGVGVREDFGPASAEEIPVFAAGMITSPLGLQDVPHVLAPAGVDDLARGAVEFHDTAVAPQPIVLIPGIRTESFNGGREGDDTGADSLPFDVMRGEETLVCGLIARGQLGAGSALLNASSHWKLIRVDAEGRVAGSRTSLGGEVVHSVQSGTILSASLPAGPLDRVSTHWLEAGARAGRRDGLLRALFGVRLLDQQKLADAPERFSFLAGACIAEDIDALLASGALTPGTPIAVSGPAAVPAAWAHLLSLAGCPATALDADTIERGFITGLLAIARRRATLAASHA